MGTWPMRRASLNMYDALTGMRMTRYERGVPFAELVG